MIYINNSDANIGIYNSQNYIATRIKSTLKRRDVKSEKTGAYFSRFDGNQAKSCSASADKQQLTYFLTTTL